VARRGQGQLRRLRGPRASEQTILDVVTYIQRRLDPTLSYRFACRVGMCGSCAMTVNGVARWTCRTHIDKVARDGAAIEIKPLANLPVIKDLVVDMAAFFDKWARAKGQYQPPPQPAAQFAVVPPATPQRREADAAIECIGSACATPPARWWRGTPTISVPPRSTAPGAWSTMCATPAMHERLRAVAGDAGCHACHSTGLHLALPQRRSTVCLDRRAEAGDAARGPAGAGCERAGRNLAVDRAARRRARPHLRRRLHLATIIYAVHHGLKRRRDPGAHARQSRLAGLLRGVCDRRGDPWRIGLRTVIRETTIWRGATLDISIAAVIVALSVAGWRAVSALFA